MLASEIELVDLRNRFLATSEEIAKGLSLLAGRMEKEPTEVRASQQTAAREITAAQERLRLEADQLEGPLEHRVAIMRAVLDAQQAAQQQLDVVVKRHRPSSLLRANLDERLANIARELAVSAASHQVEAPQVRLPITIPEAGEQAPHITSNAVEARSGTGDPPSANDDTSEEKPSPSMPLAAIIKAGASLALLLAAASTGLALFFFYANLPGARSHRELAAEQALHERNGRGIIPMPGPEGDGDGIAALSLPPTNRSTPTPTVSTMSLTVAPRENVPAAQLPKSDPLPSRLSASPSVHRDGSQAVVSAPAAQSPATPVLAPHSPMLSNDAARFVPVVFTHRDRVRALRAFAELQRRYPKQLANRQGALQLLDTGKNGIWYRLVVLPAVSHQEASETCDRLGVAGYDRCWVKAY